MTVRIIIVDDEETDRYLFRRVTKQLGVNTEIVEFVDGEDFVKVIQDPARTYDELGDDPPGFLVLLDINMPRMSGFEVLEAIDNLGTSKDRIMTVVMYSSSENKQDKIDALKSELVDDYVTKPMNPDTLRNLVSKYFAVTP